MRLAALFLILTACSESAPLATCSERFAERSQNVLTLKGLDHDTTAYRQLRARTEKLDAQLRFCSGEPPEELP